MFRYPGEIGGLRNQVLPTDLLSTWDGPGDTFLWWPMVETRGVQA